MTVGNAQQPFDRMLAMVDEALAAWPGPLEGVCQIGPSRIEPRGLRAVRYLERTEFDREVEEADIVVCHGGVGSLAIAIASGHLPIAVARRGDLGEHVNNHQLEVIMQLAGMGHLLDANQGITRDMLERARAARRSRTEARAPDLGIIGAAMARAPAEPRQFPWPLQILASLAGPIKQVR